MTEVSERITRLKERKAALLTEIAETKAEAESLKPLLTCLRCGFAWRARSLEHPPNYCSRCHSAGWNRPPRAKNSRHPSDPKNPRWSPAAALPEQTSESEFKLEDYGKQHPLKLEESSSPAVETYIAGLTGLPPLPFVPELLPKPAENFQWPTITETEPPMLVDVDTPGGGGIEPVELEEPGYEPDPFPPEPEPDPEPEPESETPDAD